MMWYLTLMTTEGRDVTVRVRATTGEEARWIARDYIRRAMPWKWDKRVVNRQWEIRWRPEAKAA